jgi:feruloyl-CoA synthase
MKLVDPDDVNKGLKFDERISEDFKLLTGTWVRAANLRLNVLDCLAPLAGDVVITGADKDQIGLMIFPNMSAMARYGYDESAQDGTFADPKLLAELKGRLSEHAKEASSSARIARAIVLSDPASLAEGETIAKGNLNFRRILTRRATMLARLYSDTDASVITL